jgi:hypothetical protein
VNTVINLALSKKLKHFWPAERLLASEEGKCSVVIIRLILSQQISAKGKEQRMRRQVLKISDLTLKCFEDPGCNLY